MASKAITANRALALIAAMFAHAVRWNLLPEGTNPCARIKKYPEQSRERFLSQAELARLGEALTTVECRGSSPQSAIAAIRLLILTGARKSEILELRWQHVDLERTALRLSDSKTGAKVIYLNAPAIDVLRSLSPVEGNEYVLPGERRGRPIVNLAKTWARVIKLAQLPGVRLHDLRHSFAAIGAGSGLGLPIIGALLGHTQAATTARYAHLAADPLRAANEAIGLQIAAALGRAAGEGP